MNSINSEVYVDISIIIKMMPIEMREKISKSFINFIEKNKSNNYVSNINPKIPIREQNIRKETKEMLGIIYRDYLCSNEEHGELIKQEEQEIKQYEEELRQYEEELRQKYNPNDIFKNKQKEYNYEKEKANVAMVEYKKETLIEKILKFFKSRFKKY